MRMRIVVRIKFSYNSSRTSKSLICSLDLAQIDISLEMIFWLLGALLELLLSLFFFWNLASTSSENKDHQWFGVSLLSGGKDQFVAVSTWCLCFLSFRCQQLEF